MRLIGVVYWPRPVDVAGQEIGRDLGKEDEVGCRIDGVTSRRARRTLTWGWRGGALNEEVESL